MSILEFADMYEIEPLRITCGKFLMSSINPNVAVFIWQQAVKYRAQPLNLDAKRYLLDNFSDSSSTNDRTSCSYAYTSLIIIFFTAPHQWAKESIT